MNLKRKGDSRTHLMKKGKEMKGMESGPDVGGGDVSSKFPLHDWKLHKGESGVAFAILARLTTRQGYLSQSELCIARPSRR
jgi:hypothetical protein